jgi:SAM-dependent methyltransferase
MMQPESPGGQLLGRLNALADGSRLRMLSLLDNFELGVGELASSLQLPQSTASRHLRRLLEAGWVTRRSEGVHARYRLSSDSMDPSSLAIWKATAKQFQSDTQADADRARAREVVAARRTDSQSFFGAVGAEWTSLRNALFGTAAATESLLALLSDDAVVVDLGCGTGLLAAQLAPWVSKVIAVDREPAMVDAARQRLCDCDHVAFHLGDITQVDLPKASADLVLAILLLHHVDTPSTVVQRAARLLKPSGRLLIVDMVRHDRSEYRDTMGHLHLGFNEDDVRSWAATNGLALTRYQRLRPNPEAQGPALFAAVLTHDNAAEQD